MHPILAEARAPHIGRCAHFPWAQTPNVEPDLWRLWRSSAMRENTGRGNGCGPKASARRLEGREHESTDHDLKREQRARKPANPSVVTLLGRSVPTMNTAHGLRATRQEQPIDPVASHAICSRSSARPCPTCGLLWQC
jgi:hypothetical protein